MVCIIADGKKHYGRLWKIVGKDKNGEVVYDEYYCCSLTSMHKEAADVIMKHENISALTICSVDWKEVKTVTYEIFDANSFRRDSQ